MDYFSLLTGYFLSINIISFLMFGYDKLKAKRNGWRIPERRFFYLGLLGGAAGVYVGMRVFRHKTRHALFIYGIPILVALNIVLFYYLLRSLGAI